MKNGLQFAQRRGRSRAILQLEEHTSLSPLLALPWSGACRVGIGRSLRTAAGQQHQSARWSGHFEHSWPLVCSVVAGYPQNASCADGIGAIRRG
jgi:hypothetical protein